MPEVLPPEQRLLYESIPDFCPQKNSSAKFPSKLEVSDINQEQIARLLFSKMIFNFRFPSKN